MPLLHLMKSPNFKPTLRKILCTQVHLSFILSKKIWHARVLTRQRTNCQLVKIYLSTPLPARFYA